MTDSAEHCFHCGEPVAPGVSSIAVVDGAARCFCCAGCEAVARVISGAGLGDFYRFRTAPSARVGADPGPAAGEWAVYDRDAVQRDFVHDAGDGVREAGFVVEGLRCAACAWLIEQHLGRIPGVLEAGVNTATGRARLRWESPRVPLSRVLAEMAALGYRPHPLRDQTGPSPAAAERTRALKRIGVAGLGMMQVMMYAVALYIGGYQAIDPHTEQYLRIISMLVATPVVLYSGMPFFLGALRGLRHRQPGMDVPVALAIAAGYFASVWVVFFGGPEVYFDSVTMFIFFLSVGRYIEMAVRHRVGSVHEALESLLPATALRLEQGRERRVAVAELAVGDRLLVRPGEPVPADGVVEEGNSSVDESLLTGESMPCRRGPGERLMGSSLNVSGPLVMRVTHLGADSVVSTIARLLDRAQAGRPPLARIAERVAGVFVLGVLLASTLVGLWWWQTDPAQAFPIVLAVLVVACPCALAMATPTAFAAATSRLARMGLLITRGDAIETLARADRLILDKTGTLTRGRLSIDARRSLDGQPGEEHLAVAAALEQHSEHPIARAFDGWRSDRRAGAVVSVPGAGLEGSVDGRRYRLGTPEFAASLAGATVPDLDATGGTWVVLGTGQGLAAAFRLGDLPRPGVGGVLRELAGAGLAVELASGDSREAVAAVAARLGIGRWQGRLDPAHKLELIRRRQAEGCVVAMVGDGVNDAPVLAGADVSVAMGSGTALAQTSADAVLLGESMEPLVEGVRTARRTLRVVRQNFIWSVAYNLTALPLAAAGAIEPWMAALGMSASSVVVILNSMRLARVPAAAAACPTPVVTGQALSR